MQKNNNLTVKVNSFSYKKGIPSDNSGNGGGYVFDCRGILNPGRIEKYKSMTGKDQAVIRFLETLTEMPNYIESIKKIIDFSINNYIEREFTDLQINFGCTGGQHRSVYAAEVISKYIKENYPNVIVETYHIEQEAKNWEN